MKNNYYRITAYHPEKDISIIMDSFGLFEKKWQFSADLIKRGLNGVRLTFATTLKSALPSPDMFVKSVCTNCTGKDLPAMSTFPPVCIKNTV